MLSASYSSLHSIKPKLVAEDGFEPPSTGYEPIKEPLLYPAIIKNLVPMTGIAPARLTARASKTRMAAVTSHRHKIILVVFRTHCPIGFQNLSLETS